MNEQSFPTSDNQLPTPQQPGSKPDPEWEIVDEGSRARPTEMLSNVHEAIEAEIVAEFLSGCPRPSSNRWKYDSEVYPESGPYPGFLATEPGPDDPPTIRARPQTRREAKKQPQGTTPDWRTEPEVHRFFTEALAERTSKGVKFTLKDGTTLRTSIQRRNERVTPQSVRWALRMITFGYRHRGLYFRRLLIPRVQHLVLRFAEILEFQDLAYPNIPPHDLRIEAMMALGALLDSLEKHGDSKGR